MRIETPIGELRVIIENNEVVEVLLPGWHSTRSKDIEEASTYSAKVEQAFYDYFEADSAKKTKIAYKKLVDVCLRSNQVQDVPNFPKEVYKSLLKDVPTGSTISYGDLAELAGKPKAARAVGTAMRKNPLPIIIPCHRVVQASGGLGGYMGNGDAGISMKKWLLRHEGVNLKTLK